VSAPVAGRRGFPAWAGLAGLGLLAVLSGCAGVEVATICPRLGISEQTGSLTRFADGGGRGQDNVVWISDIAVADLSCNYRDELGVLMEVNLDIDMVATGGPRYQGGQADVRYFVAITDLRGNIITREEFEIGIPIGGQGQGAIREETWQLYNLEEGGTGARYEVWVGFMLSDEELQHNRSQQNL